MNFGLAGRVFEWASQLFALLAAPTRLHIACESCEAICIERDRPVTRRRSTVPLL